MKKSVKLPTILGIFILVAGLVAGIFLINSRQVFKLGAQADALPKDIRIGNITDSSVTITWTTDTKSKGFIKWNQDSKNLTKISLEEEGDLSNVHLVNLSGISAGKNVFFSINSNGKDYQNNGAPWQTRTSDTKISPNWSLVAKGIILTQDGKTPAKAVVHLIINGLTFSTLTSSEGNWIIPVDRYIEQISENTVIQIEVNSGLGNTSQAIIYPKAITNTPPMLLGKSYDFRTSSTEKKDLDLPKSSLSLPEAVEKSSRFEINNTEIGQSISVTIDSIKDGEIITTFNPEFFGTAPTGSQIQISVESELQTETVIANKNGVWNWSPPNALEEGEHTITIKWTSENGIVKTINRRFYVSASEGPAFESTPSATPLVPLTTATPDPVVSTSTPTTQPIPETGNLTPTIGLFIMSIGMLLGSVYFLGKEYAQR